MLLNQKICKPVRILVHQTHLYKPESLYVLLLLTLCLYLKPAYIHVYNYFNVFIYILGDKRKRILNAFTLRRSIRYHLTIISPSPLYACIPTSQFSFSFSRLSTGSYYTYTYTMYPLYNLSNERKTVVNAYTQRSRLVLSHNHPLIHVYIVNTNVLIKHWLDPHQSTWQDLSTFMTCANYSLRKFYVNFATNKIPCWLNGTREEPVLIFQSFNH